MSSILHQNVVLVLNRNWQAVNTATPAMAFSQMCTDVATALDIHGHEALVPTKWEDWVKLPVREGDLSIGTAKGRIRVPTVVVLANYAQVPMRAPKLCARNIWHRDGGRCQYTGRKLSPGEGNLDHVLPRSRGGGSTWNNLVLACREVNRKKADRTPEEAGLRLLRKPEEPRPVPATLAIRNAHGIPDWEMFLPAS